MPNLTQEQLNEQLFEAVDHNDIEAVKNAIEAGADVNAIREDDSKPLHWAARWGYTDIAKMLIEKGADVNAKDEYDRRPLYWASKCKQKETAELLKQHGGV